MQKLKEILVLVLFALSCCTLFWLTGSRTPWTLFQNGSREGGYSVHLGDVPVENYDRMGFTRALIKYVKSEDGWLVGTDKGELFLFNKTGRQMWKRSLGVGKLVSLATDRSGTRAYVGESSAEGNLYCVRIHTGDIAWQYKGADFAGSDASLRSYPSTVHIAVDAAGNAYANMYRFVMDKNGRRGYNGRMIAVSPEGQLLWKFPANEVIDSWINWCDTSDAAGQVVISTSSFDFRPEMKYKGTLYFLDKRTGDMLNEIFIPPVEPFDNTVMRGSPNYAADGSCLAGASSDGRGFLLDTTGKILWWRYLSKATQIDNAWLNASGRDGYVLPQGILFSTINTFNRENWQLPTPVEHPSNNSLFLFTPEGKFKYQYRAAAPVESVAFAAGKAACAIGRNVRTHEYKAHGLVLLDLETGKEEKTYPTQGPCQAAGISDDGEWVAGVEAPAITPEGKIIGSYLLHIWSTKTGGGQ